MTDIPPFFMSASRHDSMAPARAEATPEPEAVSRNVTMVARKPATVTRSAGAIAAQTCIICP